MNNEVQCLCTNDSCFNSGIKSSDGDIRRNHLEVELCAIKNCEKLIIQRKILAKYTQGAVSPHTDTGHGNLLQKDGQTDKICNYCWCLY